MAYLPDCIKTDIAQFNGVWLPSTSGVDETKIPLDHGRAGRNVQYFGDSVITRFGHSSVFSPADIVTRFINWLFTYGTPATQHNYLAWLAQGAGVKIANLASSPTGSLVMTETTSQAACILAVGARLYVAFLTAGGAGSAAGQVYGFGVGAEPLFAAPMTTVPVVTDFVPGPLPISSRITPGEKLYGYLILTKNGHTTPPSPINSDIFVPVDHTSPSSPSQVQMTITATWPAYAAAVIPVMTTSANLAQFFIPPAGVTGGAPWTGGPLTPGAFGVIVPVVGGATSTIVFTIGLSDDLLASAGTDATAYFNEMRQSTAGAAPIQPSFIGPYGQRLGYTGLDASGIPVTYFSDSSNPQSINAATSGVYLPGQLGQTMFFALRGVAYILGPHWTYAVSDSGGVPATWAEPQLVDGAIGVLGQFCATLNASQNYAWVADTGGLYLFTGGSYPERPISYYQAKDWNRINWNFPTAVQVTDDASNKRVHVIAPLDSATTPSHILTWDYSLGPTPEQVKYAGASSLSGYPMGAIGMVQNPTSMRVEKWLASSSAGSPVVRETNATDTNPYRDISAAIDSLYETSLVPQGGSGRLMMHHAAESRIRGAGHVLLTVWTLDHTSSVGPFDLGALSTGPGQEILQRFFVNNEQVSLQFQSDGQPDTYFQLSDVAHYYTPGMPQR